MDDKQNKTRWQITLEDAGGTTSGITRLKWFLKAAIRCYGLKCITITEEKRTELPQGATESGK